MRLIASFITAYLWLPARAFALTALSVSSFMVGCSSMEKSIGFGGGVGAITGTGIGIAVEPSAGSALIGAGVGMILGGALGYLGHRTYTINEIEKPDNKLKLLEPGEEPPLTSPSVERIWIPPKIEGERYLEGHWLYIHKAGRWRGYDGE